jgi:hypothetical protein
MANVRGMLGRAAEISETVFSAPAGTISADGLIASLITHTEGSLPARLRNSGFPLEALREAVYALSRISTANAQRSGDGAAADLARA